MAENKRSSIWEFFVETDGGRRAKCVECNASLSRGGTGKIATNSSMINHLKQHANLYRMYQEKTKEHKVAKLLADSSQPTIQESFGCHQWEDDSTKAKDITKSIAEMIILDHQPISMVTDRGFQRLMTKLQPKYKVRIFLITFQ